LGYKPQDPFNSLEFSVAAMKPKIEKIETAKVPPRWGLVKIVLSDGTEGFGEFTVEGQLNPAEAVVKQLAPHFIGKSVEEGMREIEAQHHISFYHDGPHFQSGRAGIEIALWDLKGKLLGAPIYDLVGAKLRDRVKVYQWAGGNEPNPDKAAAEAKRAVEGGLRAIKLNACLPTASLDFDGKIPLALEVARAVRDAVGPTIDIGFDFHGRCQFNSAVELASALKEVRPKFYEEPVRAEFNHLLPAIRAAAPGVVLATGERMYLVANFLQPAVAENIGLFQPDIVHIGGITNTLAVARIAEATGKAIAPHCPLSPIAFLACLQVVVSSHAGCILESAKGIHYNEHLKGDGKIDPWLRFVAEQDRGIFEIQDGHMRIPEKPGLGVAFDWSAVQAAALEHEAGTPWEDSRLVLADGLVTDW